MKLAAATILAFASSAAAFSAPTMTFSLGKGKKGKKAVVKVSWLCFLNGDFSMVGFCLHTQNGSP